MFCLLRTHTLTAAALLLCATAQADEPATPTRSQPNRLSKETSPYLLLHAHNPVDWHPWGPEAFEKARQEDKPIFLSIGYSSCYWCHVMERLVFSDPEIAAYMNKHFVNIKVDREERPDVDDIYMTALTIYYQLVKAPQGGGWPLSMFLTPTGKPFTGGSYFPPKDDAARGRIGFPTVMKDVQNLWETRRKDLEQNADTITGYVQTVSKPQLNLQPVTLDRKLATAASEALTKSFDAEFGGVDLNPENPEGNKFPVPTKLAFLQAELRRTQAPALGNVIYLTLDHIAAGGIYDHLAGGFHRYSTDRYWHVPHFEKMLYDQAQLACVYLEAFRQTKKPLYRDTAVGVLDFVLDQMTDKQGGFYSALDAETDAVEGKFYVWSAEEIAAALGEQDAALFGKVYGLEAERRFEPGYVLHIAQPLEKVAAAANLSATDLEFKLAGMREKLRKARAQRKPPLRDDKVLASWNGLMIRAFAEAGKLLERPDYTRAAEAAAKFVLTKMLDDQQRLTRTWRNDQARLNAYLDDYAFVTDGLLALHETTGDAKWLDAARKVTDQQLARFWDDRQGGFYFTASDHEEMIVRIKNAYDSVLPSGNSVSVRNLLRLAVLTGEKSYREKAETTLKLFAPSLEKAPRGMTNMALALSEFLEGPAPRESNASGPIQQTTLKQPAPEEMPADVVTGRPYFSVEKLPPGQTCYVCVVLTIQEGWHINATPGRPAELMPAFTIKSKLGTKLAKPFFPQPVPATVEWSEKEVQVYEKQIYVYGQVEVPPNAAGLTEELELYLRYQVCNDKKCLLPKVVSMKGKLQVANVGEPVKPVNQQFFKPKEN